MHKDWLGLLSIAVTIAVTIPYLIKMRQGKIRPHIFTWVIWSLTTGIAAAARGAAHAGAGAWGQWAGAVSCFSVVLLALSKGEHNITRSDFIAFAVALSAIPAWLLTDSPLVALVIVTSIDVVGYYPTFRKCYSDPHHEAIFNYVVANVIHVISLGATQDYTLTTILFPATLFAINTALISFVMWRRRIVPAQQPIHA